MKLTRPALPRQPIGTFLRFSWPTFQYMVSEVQYGGKITDDLDRRMFKTYTQVEHAREHERPASAGL